MDRSRRRVLRPNVERLDARALLTGLTPAQVVGAYGLNAIEYNVNGQVSRGDGSGQTIAIVTAFHHPTLISDLKVFDQKFGLPEAQVVQLTTPGTLTDDGWASEAMLDVEWAHAVAPGANLVVVEAMSDALHDMLAAANQARTIPGVSVVSMSWGSVEFSGVGAFDSYFTTPAGHNGVSFVASTGDGSGRVPTTWPAISSNVLAVGGTTLRVDASGRYLGESAWSSGGGSVSRYEAKPAYQLGATPYTTRSAADVSAVGDPETGVQSFVTSPSTGRGVWQVVGGTSLAVPIWAGLLAIINQGRSLIGLDTLDGPTQTLPAIYSAPATSFHDVVAGSNGYAASPGYDLPTGRGTPNGPFLVNSLVGWTATFPNPGVVPTTPVSVRASASNGPRNPWSPTRRYDSGGHPSWNRHGLFRFATNRGHRAAAARAPHHPVPQATGGGLGLAVASPASVVVGLRTPRG